MLPSFSIKLNNPVLQGLMTMGRFDGVHPAVAVASGADNLVIHSPHTRNEKSEHDVKTLSINRRITALAAGSLNDAKAEAQAGQKAAAAGAGGAGAGAGSDAARDVLVVGSASNLLVYDVHNNSDVFFKDVADGVFSLAVGVMAGVGAPLAVVGSNCAIQGYDLHGEERFWTVAGDNVTALAFASRDAKDNRNELLVGGEDFEIRVLRHEEVLCEIQEADAVVGLTGLGVQQPLFGYALRNGTIGVYNRAQRLWHAKSKHKVSAVASFDLDADGVPELISGWSNGRIEVRRDTDGTLIAKHKFDAAIAGVCVGDYHMAGDGKHEIVACSVDGDVRGFAPMEKEHDNSALIALNAQHNALKQLSDIKQQLLSELKSYEANLKKTGAPAAGTSAGAAAAKDGAGLNAVVGVIPADTKISLSVRPNLQTKSLLLTVGTNNDTVVKFVAVFADGLFGSNESCVAHPAKPAGALAMAIQPEKDAEALLTIKAAIGVRNSVQDHVYEATFALPKFASYVYVNPQQIHEHKIALPRSSVTFRMAERANRLALWIGQAFLLEEKMLPATQLEALNVGFLSTRDGSPLFIILSPENGGQLQVRTDNLELAAELVQDMCRYLKIDALESVVDFPAEMTRFEEVLQHVQEYYAQRLKLSAEMADSSNLVKTLVVRAEDARLLNDMHLMMKMYSQLMDSNRELIGECTKRANNNNELSRHLKEVNQVIQKAARLRMGDAKTQLVDACRKAVQSNNTQQLLKLVKFGVSTGK